MDCIRATIHRCALMLEAAQREKWKAILAARCPSGGDVVNEDGEQYQSDQIKQ
jgi:hypothetical protein